jgi:hypothetical protein
MTIRLPGVLDAPSESEPRGTLDAGESQVLVSRDDLGGIRVRGSVAGGCYAPVSLPTPLPLPVLGQAA